MLPLLIILYIILAGCLVFLSEKIGSYIDLLDKKTKISGAFLGGVILAAVTSLPELFTSISATLLVQEDGLVIGNILGSNLFNVAILGVCLMLFFKVFRKGRIEYKFHNFTFLGLAIVYALICYGLFVPRKFQPQVGPINFICPLILVVYGLIIFLQPKEVDKPTDETSEKEENKDNCPLSVKQILIRFSICAVLLVGISIAITYVTDDLANRLKLDTTLAGALFLAIATSLPELVSCVTLCYKKNFNAALGDIIGSCFFNFCIIGISEFLAYRTSLMSELNRDAMIMTIITIICLVLLFILICIKRFTVDKKSQDKSISWFDVLTIATGLLIFSGYIIFLII